MIPFEDLAAIPSSWLSAEGPQADRVISSRVRIARNVAGKKFPHRASVEESQALVDALEPALTSLASLRNASFLRLDELTPLDRELLAERHLIQNGGPAQARALAVRPDERAAVAVNEEDHLRISGFVPGFDPWEALRLVKEIDTELEYYVEPCYKEPWGYLTACPTNVGTALRASVLVHLPGLVLTREVGKVIGGLSQIGLAVRGFRGEGSEVVGNLFQVSNQVTLGKSEEEIVDMVYQVTAQLLQYEQQAQEVLLRDARYQLEDKIWRALGLLKTARLLSTTEALGLVSAVRLGLSLNLMEGIEMALLNELVELVQPAHVERREGEELTAEERDARRATYVRRRLVSE